jgi:hypothetical protein
VEFELDALAAADVLDRHLAERRRLVARSARRSARFDWAFLIAAAMSSFVKFWRRDNQRPPIVSASTRGIEFMLRHGIRGLVGAKSRGFRASW